MVAAHIKDLDAASKLGFKTVYVRRPTEDIGLQEGVKLGSSDGEADLIVDSFEEFADVLGKIKSS